MGLPGAPSKVFLRPDECSNCHAELDNGRHVCMSDFTVPSSEPIMMAVNRKDGSHHYVRLKPGDEIEFNVIDDEDE